MTSEHVHGTAERRDILSVARQGFGHEKLILIYVIVFYVLKIISIRLYTSDNNS